MTAPNAQCLVLDNPSTWRLTCPKTCLKTTVRAAMDLFWDWQKRRDPVAARGIPTAFEP
jgi:hypothetical protein